MKSIKPNSAIDKYYRYAQARWARKMNALTEGLSRKTLQWLLVLFIVLSSSYLLYNIYAVCYKDRAGSFRSAASVSTITTITIKKTKP